MATKGIGYNPTLTNTYQTNNQNNNWYDNITSSRYNNYNNYDGAQEYDADYDENYGKSLAGSVGHFDVNKLMNRRLPSHLSHDMGVSNYQAPVGNYQGTQFDPSQGNMPYNPVEKTGILQSIKNKGMKFMTPLMAIANKFNPLSPTSSNFNPMLEGQLDLAKGGIDEGGLGWGVDDIGRFTSGPLAGQASMSAFGTNDITAQLRARKQKIATRKIAQTAWSRKKQAEIQAAIDAQVAAENAGYSGTPGGNTGSGAFAKFDNTTKDYGPHSKGGSNQSGGSFSGAGAGTGAQGPAGGQSSQGNYGGGRRDGPSGRKAYGGRAGFRNGEFVDEDINVQGPNFDFNENIEMAETSPFEMRIQELIDDRYVLAGSLSNSFKRIWSNSRRRWIFQ